MKIKLAIVNRHFSKTAGGAESLAVSMAQSMQPECEITVISQNFDTALTGFRCIRVPKFFIPTRWLNQLWFSWYSKRLIQQHEHPFDVVHSFENITHGDLHTVSVKTVHASLKERGISALRIALSPRLLAYLWLEKKRMCTAGHHSVFVSEFVANETKAVLPNLFKSHVITPGVSIPAQRLTAAQKTAAKQSFGLKPDVMTIGFVGHDFKKKGLDVLLQGAARLPFDVQILVFGKTDMASKYDELVRNLGAGKSCRFMGVVGDMPNAYAAMDCLAHPTKQDVFPMTLLEAMAHHVPVLTTQEPHNNMGSLLTHGANAGLLADPDDSSAMADLLMQVWQDNAWAETVACGGFAFAQNYSWEASKAKYYAVYRQVNPKLQDRL